MGIGIGEHIPSRPKRLSSSNGDYMVLRLFAFRNTVVERTLREILRGGAWGGWNVQQVNEDDSRWFDSGGILKTHDIRYSCISTDPRRIILLLLTVKVCIVSRLFSEVQSGKAFSFAKVQRKLRILLSTSLHAQSTDGLTGHGQCRNRTFICASSTSRMQVLPLTCVSKRIHLKSCQSDTIDGTFHPFMTRSGVSYLCGKGVYCC